MDTSYKVGERGAKIIRHNKDYQYKKANKPPQKAIKNKLFEGGNVTNKSKHLLKSNFA